MGKKATEEALNFFKWSLLLQKCTKSYQKEVLSENIKLYSPVCIIVQSRREAIKLSMDCDHLKKDIREEILIVWLVACLPILKINRQSNDVYYSSYFLKLYLPICITVLTSHCEVIITDLPYY